MTVYTFYWAPEGRRLCDIAADSVEEATAQFKREYRYTYAKAMGEVYWTTERV